MIAQGYQAMLVEEVFLTFMHGTDDECKAFNQLLDDDDGESHMDEIDNLVQGIKHRIEERRRCNG